MYRYCQNVKLVFGIKFTEPFYSLNPTVPAIAVQRQNPTAPVIAVQGLNPTAQSQLFKE